jgi:hypothetical protein
VVSGAHPPGTLLDPERVEQEPGVSRTVVREMLRVLGAKGMVAARPARSWPPAARDRLVHDDPSACDPIPSHQQVLDAVREREPELAAAAMLRLLAQAERDVRRAIRRRKATRRLCRDQPQAHDDMEHLAGRARFQAILYSARWPTETSPRNARLSELFRAQEFGEKLGSGRWGHRHVARGGTLLRIYGTKLGSARKVLLGHTAAAWLIHVSRRELDLVSPRHLPGIVGTAIPSAAQYTFRTG